MQGKDWAYADDMEALAADATTQQVCGAEHNNQEVRRTRVIANVPCHAQAASKKKIQNKRVGRIAEVSHQCGALKVVCDDCSALQLRHGLALQCTATQ
jgi:hypothetical protein